MCIRDSLCLFLFYFIFFTFVCKRFCKESSNFVPFSSFSGRNRPVLPHIFHFLSTLHIHFHAISIPLSPTRCLEKRRLCLHFVFTGRMIFSFLSARQSNSCARARFQKHNRAEMPLFGIPARLFRFYGDSNGKPSSTLHGQEI